MLRIKGKIRLRFKSKYRNYPTINVKF